MSIWEYANPKKFSDTFGPLVPWLLALGIGVFGLSLIWGFFFTPDDARQGAAAKIMFVHVPTAFLGTSAWFMMVVTSCIWLIRRHHVSALAAKAAAPVGMVATLAGLITGAIWGAPIWGTWWAWEPKLTAFLILFFFYLGYIALWDAVEDPDTAADLTSALAIVGSVFAVLSRYAVQFWRGSLHQDSSLSMDADTPMAPEFANPLMLGMAGILILFVGLVLMRTITEINLRRAAALERRALQDA